MSTGALVYHKILHKPLTESIQNSYALLPATPRPWLIHSDVSRPFESVFFRMAAGLPMCMAGLAVVLLVRPRSAAADLSYGLATGLVAAYVSAFCGGVWAFAGIEVERTFYGVRENDNSLAFKWNWLHGLKETRVLDLGEYGQKVYEPDWQEDRYPDLKGLPAERQRQILYDKMACDAVLGVQTSLLKALPVYITGLILLPALQTLAAGYLWRRYQRPWLVTAAYAERIIPLALTLFWSAVLVWGAFWIGAAGPVDWFATFQGMAWRMEVVIVAAVMAQVAAWRGWYWPLRLLLHAAWIGSCIGLIVVPRM